ncbi:MAG: hypothetical protein A2868_03550 [Candidatus Levybacteria bacterium RIFCSPHIGHO2_01_FULL_40_15b]|nr:MAG: hypothetical protein A2868_03550 [Candidatus Levybacteria bacterium RIFCSPHIGHO2_01_FULL_40_15b]
MAKIVIGLVGPIASGKGTVIDILKNKGYTPYSLSDALKEEIRARGLEITRFNCNRISNELRETQEADVLARRTVEVIDQDKPELVAIDAIRNPLEIKFLQNKFGAKIIGVVADRKKRYKMFRERGTYTDEIQTFEQFKELDDREFAQAGEHKQQIKACLELSDVVIDNNGTIEELRQKVYEFISSI